MNSESDPPSIRSKLPPTPATPARDVDQQAAWFAIANGIQVAALALIFNSLFLADVEVWFSIRVLLLIVLVLAAVTSRSWVILIAAIGTSLVGGTPDRGLDITFKSVAYPLAILLLTAYFYLFPRLRSKINAFIVYLIRPQTSVDKQSSQMPPQPSVWFQLTQSAILLTGLVAVSASIVAWLPTERRQKIEVYQTMLTSDQLRLSLCTLLIGLVAAYLVLREMNYRRMNTSQARLVLRSHLMRDYGKELLSIHRRMRKQEKRRLKKSQSSKPSSV